MNQELVLAVVAVLGGIFLLVGLVQLLAPPPRRRRRRVRRRSRVAPPRREGKPTAAAAPIASSSRRAPPVFTPRSRPAVADTPPPPASPKVAEPTSTVAPPPAPHALDVTRPAALPAEAARPPVPESAAAAWAPPRAPGVELPLGQCQRLYERHQYQQVIATAEPALQGALSEAAAAAPRPRDIARLWSLLALSRQALGDHEGAHSAFEEAIHIAPADDRPSYQAQMAVLVTSISRRLLERAGQAAEGAGEERIRQLRQAVVWLRQGLAQVPGDADLAAALERASDGLWATYDQTAAVLIQRQEFHRARRLIRGALAEEEFLPDRREQFMELLASTFTGEIGQLTASAIRTLEDERESDALSFLRRAEGILSNMPPEVLTPKRREDVSRQLWWGYAKAGMRRVEAGAFEQALEPLFRALEIAGSDPERQGETRQALARALEGLCDARSALITQLAKDGSRSAAVEEAERLKSLMRESLERGLSQQELSRALTQAQRVVEALERGSA